MEIEWFKGEVFSPQVIKKAMLGVNYVFHVAAAYREAKIDDIVYYNVHIESTKLLAKNALIQENFKRFIHISTVGVLGHIDNPPADEDTEYKPGDIYQSTKTEAEKWILQYYKDQGLPASVVRPAAIYGPGDRRLLKLFKIAKLPLIPLIGYSKGLYHLIHVEDLVRFMIYLACHPETAGEVYICGSPKPVSIKKILEDISQCMGRSAKFVRIPAWPIFLLGDLCEAICKPLNIEPPIYHRRIAFFTKDRAFSTKRMQATGFRTQISDKEGLQQLFQWYQQQGWL
jgi:nucleoside-diphosphate-sugar epimerase